MKIGLGLGQGLQSLGLGVGPWNALLLFFLS